MKQKTAKPSRAIEQGMQFFTPELYLRFNDPDDAAADRADEEWEAAIADYRSHLQEIDSQLSSEARMLSRTCLHDAELLADVESPVPNLGRTVGKWPGWSLVAVLSFKLNDEAVSLVYHLWDRLQKRPAPTAWHFSRERTHLLYDEIDVRSGGRFMHRLLLSDGVVMEVPFVSVLLHRFAWPRVAGRKMSRIIA